MKRLTSAGVAVMTLLGITVTVRAEGPLTPGFWSFTAEPGANSAVLDDYCSNGFWLVLDDTNRMSFYADGDSLINDGVDNCTFDPASSTETCQSRLWAGEDVGYKEFTAHTVYTRDTTGALKTVTTVQGEAPTTLYPLQCRAEVVRDSLSKALAPKL